MSNSYASSTPATDGERLYVLFAEHGLYCYDLNGNKLWDYPLEARETILDYGYAASPIAYDNRVIFTHDDEEDSFIVMLDGETGKEIWKVPRDELTSYTTPVIWENDLRTEIFSVAERQIRSYRLDGALLWTMDAATTMRPIPLPVVSGNLAFASSGDYERGQHPVYAFKPGANGAIRGGESHQKKSSSEFIQWHFEGGGAEITSSLVYDDCFYTLHDRGYVGWNDATTGEVVYEGQRLRGKFMASPWAYNDQILSKPEGQDLRNQAGP